MKYLVTGGAGFIGSWLCERLLDKGEVVCLDKVVQSFGNLPEFHTAAEYPDLDLGRAFERVDFCADGE